MCISTKPVLILLYASIATDLGIISPLISSPSPLEDSKMLLKQLFKKQRIIHSEVKVVAVGLSGMQKHASIHALCALTCRCLVVAPDGLCYKVQSMVSLKC